MTKEQKTAQRWALLSNIWMPIFWLIVGSLFLTFASLPDLFQEEPYPFWILLVLIISGVVVIASELLISNMEKKAKKALANPDHIYSFNGSFCPSCGKKVAVSSEYCPSCGKKIEHNAEPLFVIKDNNVTYSVSDFYSMLFYGSWGSYISVLIMFVESLLGSIFVARWRWLWIVLAVFSALLTLLVFVYAPFSQASQRKKAESQKDAPTYVFEDSIAQVIHQVSGEDASAYATTIAFGFDQVVFCKENERGYYFVYTPDGKRGMVMMIKKDASLESGASLFLHNKIKELSEK